MRITPRIVRVIFFLVLCAVVYLGVSDRTVAFIVAWSCAVVLWLAVPQRYLKVPGHWRVFAIVNAIGVFMIMFATIDGHPVRTALAPVGMILMMPGFVACIALGSILQSDFLTALSAVPVNALAWGLFFCAMGMGKREQ